MTYSNASLEPFGNQPITSPSHDGAYESLFHTLRGFNFEKKYTTNCPPS